MYSDDTVLCLASLVYIVVRVASRYVQYRLREALAAEVRGRGPLPTPAPVWLAVLCRRSLVVRVVMIGIITPSPKTPALFPP